MTDSPDAAERRSDEFHMHVGYCIAEWAKIEEELFRICWQCLGSGVRQAAVVYYKSVSIETRLLLVDELIMTVMPTPTRKSGEHQHQDLKKWTVLKTELSDLKPMRNRLAHHPVTPWDIEVVGLGAEPMNVIWHEIETGYWERLRPGTKTYEPIKIEDLIVHRPAVQALAARLKEFRVVTLFQHVPIPPTSPNSEP